MTAVGPRVGSLAVLVTLPVLAVAALRKGGEVLRECLFVICGGNARDLVEYRAPLPERLSAADAFHSEPRLPIDKLN